MSQISSRPRLESIDVLRGVVMIIMALDHTRDFFGTFGANPTNLANTTAPLFFTRWITHICAPTFFLLTGTGAGLASAARSKSELSRYLILRGLLLIVLELTLIRGLAYQFNFDYQVTLLLVIWALGWAMIFLGLIVFLPVSIIAAIG
ncbi:MAG TPA: heparan-alpha-glucosaminide N-acetyltransferase domain-containing protein, partial [Gemmatimonadaceae bacterium]